MRRLGRRRETPEVSLFPFLAVLICTFGVLFILLVLAVKAADESAKKASEIDREQVEKQIDELNSQLDLELVRSAGLSEIRPELVDLDQPGYFDYRVDLFCKKRGNGQ